MPTKTCPGCGQEKLETEFNFKDRATGRRQVRCRDCTRAQLRSHYSRNTAYYLEKARKRNQEVIEEQRALILQYLASHPCVDCGESDVVCLEFDHVRGEKRGDIAHMLGDHSWATILEEIAKCDVRCANCHRRRTGIQRLYYRSFIGVDQSRP